MLPTHVFTDVVGYLHLYDLDALLLTDARRSKLAHVAASRIRIFDFSEFQFDVYTNKAVVFKLIDGQALPDVATLKFLDEADLADFIRVAMRNCVLGNLALCHKESFDLMSGVAHTVVVKGRLFLYASAFVKLHSLVEFVASFRSVKSVCVFAADALDTSQADELLGLFDSYGFGQDEDTGRPSVRVSFYRSPHEH